MHGPHLSHAPTKRRIFPLLPTKYQAPVAYVRFLCLSSSESSGYIPLATRASTACRHRHIHTQSYIDSVVGVMNLPHAGLLLPANVNPLPPAPWLYPTALPAAPLQSAPAQPLPPAKSAELSDRDARLLKRKQANRDSARRSKLKKKQETEELVVKRTQLSDLHNDLIKRVREAQSRVRQLQQTNVGLKQQYTSLMRTAESTS